jgi:hypothetical protein
MARLLTVVNERKKLRSEYRIHLENQYIAEKKDLELKAFLANREGLKKSGSGNVPMTPEEVKEMFKKREASVHEMIKQSKEKILSQVEAGETTLAPNISKEDIEFLATTRVKLSQKEILKMYVGNWASLDLK